METIDALGFVEVYGLVAGIEAADAMLKSARVRLLRQHEVNPGLITVVVEGDLAACRAAVNAGVAAAERVGKVISSHVIGRPDPDTETLVVDLASAPSGGKAAAAGQAAAKPEAGAAGADTAATPRPAAVDGALAFIAGTAKGRSWNEIARRFPDGAEQLRAQLDACVESGALHKVGSRYRKPEEQ